MKSSDFFGKLTSKYIWLNLAAMAAVLVVLAVGVKFGIDIYTHHGEAIPIPDIRRKSFADAKHILANATAWRPCKVGTRYLRDCELWQYAHHHHARHHRQQFYARGNGQA